MDRSSLGMFVHTRGRFLKLFRNGKASPKPRCSVTATLFTFYANELAQALQVTGNDFVLRTGLSSCKAAGVDVMITIFCNF
jgi:hypothetical protein